MTKLNGEPCKKCKTSDWYKDGNCKQCTHNRQKKYRQRNPKKMLEKTKRWQRNNPKKTKEMALKSREKNREKERERVKEWAKNNPIKEKAKSSRRRTRKTKAGGEYTKEEWTSLCSKHGNKCLMCKKKMNARTLTADHVLPVSKGGSSNISNIQPLCRRCNSKKGTSITDYR